jgi:hypothetical protein
VLKEKDRKENVYRGIEKREHLEKNRDRRKFEEQRNGKK